MKHIVMVTMYIMAFLLGILLIIDSATGVNIPDGYIFAVMGSYSTLTLVALGYGIELTKVSEPEPIKRIPKVEQDVLIKPSKKISVYDFLYHETVAGSTWIITYGGWREAIFWIDDEDLWSSWFPKQHEHAFVKSYSYNEATMQGRIEYYTERLSEETLK